jgi:hypothetical protein
VLSVAAGLTVLLAVVWARAQFSPGELSKAHHQLEGLRNCEKCHEPGAGLSNARCTSCHSEIAKRQDAKDGLHGRAVVREASCDSCHHEHRGEAFDIRALEEKTFDHNRTGFALDGQHQKVKCTQCHDPRLITDKSVENLRKQTGRKTYLGLGDACASCHFDEHRGQLGAKCETCHTSTGWKPASKFSHATTGFPLTGKHRAVACSQCHTSQNDPAHGDAFLPPHASTFARFSDVAHSACTSCHEDAHDGHFGQRCTSCHSTEGWHALSKQAADSGFHDKTRFPLRGGHIGVPCQQCHGPAGGKPAVFKGLPFAACTDCHADVHAGQLAAAKAGKGATCDACHTVESFTPTTFTVDQHAGTAFPLDGAHAAVPCSTCHTQDAKLKKALPKAVATRLAAFGRSAQVVTTSFTAPGPLQRCETCHRDPHGGQFNDTMGTQGCTACHNTRSFHDVAFDHDKDTGFPLSGAHHAVQCTRCHETVVGKNGERKTVYASTPKQCAACHTDVHMGQLAAANGATDCAGCHETSAFKTTHFDHASTRFALVGAHSSEPCVSCHTRVHVKADKDVIRFKPLPTQCAECHRDAHNGAYSTPEFTSLVGIAEVSSGALSAPCDTCHKPETWHDVHFAQHDKTSFPLSGAHAKADCSECHQQGFAQAMVHNCTACHRDPHAGSLGAQCAGCHDANSWQSQFDTLAHLRRGFPLIGRHAVIPCQECHPAQQRGFAAAPVQCVSCHRAQYDQTGATSIDHAAAGFSTRCEQCHDPVRFKPARFPQHDKCFALSGGPHYGIACNNCHTSLAGAQITGACATGTAACSGCHEHRCSRTDTIHQNVSGYQCRDRKCYECHRFAE